MLISAISDKQEPRNIELGLSSLFGLIFDTHEEFYKEYKSYQKGEIELETLLSKAEETSFRMLQLTNILDTFEFISKEDSSPMIDLMYYYVVFKDYTEDQRLESLEELNELIRKNHVICVPQYYDKYPLIANGELPEELSNFFEGVGKLIIE